MHIEEADLTKDGQAVEGLLHALYPEHPTRRFRPSDTSRGTSAWLARDRDTAVGLLISSSIDDGWERYAIIEQLVVLPEHRGKGIGRGLIETAMEHLGRDGTTVVFVTTNDDAAQRFYERAGFSPTGPWLARSPQP